MAQVYAYRGEVDSAFEWLEKRFVQEGAGGWGEQKLDRLFDNLREDARWPAFLEKMHASDAQLAAIEFDLQPPE